jgi:hypothetical protein
MAVEIGLGRMILERCSALSENRGKKQNGNASDQITSFTSPLLFLALQKNLSESGKA